MRAAAEEAFVDLYSILDQWLGERIGPSLDSKVQWLPKTRWVELLDRYTTLRVLDPEFELLIGDAPQVPRGELHVAVVPEVGQDLESLVSRRLISAHGTVLKTEFFQHVFMDVHAGGGRAWPELRRLARLRPLHDIHALTLIETPTSVSLLDPVRDQWKLLKNDRAFLFDQVGAFSSGGKTYGFRAYDQWEGFALTSPPKAKAYVSMLRALEPAAMTGALIPLFNESQMEALGLWLVHTATSMSDFESTSPLVARQADAIRRLVKRIPEIQEGIPTLKTVADLPLMKGGNASLDDVLELRRNSEAFYEYLNLLKDVVKGIPQTASEEDWEAHARIELRERLTPVMNRLRAESSLMRDVVSGAASGLVLAVLGSASSVPFGGSLVSDTVAATSAGSLGAAAESFRSRADRRVARATMGHLQQFISY